MSTKNTKYPQVGDRVDLAYAPGLVHCVKRAETDQILGNTWCDLSTNMSRSGHMPDVRLPITTLTTTLTTCLNCLANHHA